ncbi:hypothetical protein L218DRAFT_974327 [Marasmius fiardii PR-910]|nr:hypothetical protein L218DRAFT_974327 [Marasmius fiardii PR-910]
MSPVGASTSNSQMAIDPQLVDSPIESATRDHENSDDEGEEKASSKKASSPEPTITITPVKVGGHGKSRKGTVQSGGITKKHPSTPSTPLSSATSTPPASSTATASKNKENLAAKKGPSSSAASDQDKDEDDDLPADWRPPPEVFQKMTSKEKRQLRNKISARNFRVRRKEYISTLELDIAERDRLLQAIRSELGSTQSENLALRQEIAALKKVLLEGRQLTPAQMASSPQATVMVKGAGEGMNINLNAVNGVTLEDFLPPPAPLPERSAADEILARAAAAVSSSPSNASSATLVTPNTQKDVSLSSQQAAFWGGVGGYGHGFGLGGGVTPVHTVLMPEMSTAGLRHQQQEDLNVSKWVRDVLAAQAQASMEEEEEQSHHHHRRLQENMNPALNGSMEDVEEQNTESPEFEKWVDDNTFTMKSIDAYRMHLWTKMAASHQPSNTRTTKYTPPSSPPSPPAQSPAQSPTIMHKKYHPDRISSPSPFAPFPSQSSSPPSHYLTSPHLINPKAQLSNRSLASQLKPHYFMSSQKANLATSSTSPPSLSPLSKMLGTGLLGTGVGSGLTKKQSTSMPSTTATAEQQQMMYAATATLASQTLLGKLGGAFWDAFSGGSGSSKPSGSSGVAGRSWDADKVRKVLEGKAVVRVVDVDDVKSPHLIQKDVGVKKEVVASPVLGPSLVRKDNASCDPTEWLEEKMKHLSLAKKN